MFPEPSQFRKRQGSLRGWGYLGGVVFLATGLVGLPSGDPAVAQSAPSSLASPKQDPQAWLERYNAALEQLPPLPNLQYRQQVRVEGSQTFTATLDVLYRRDGSWQAWVAEGDRIRLLDSRQLEVVNQSDLLQLYSVYVSRPEALLPSVSFYLKADPSRYRVLSSERVDLAGSPVQHLRLEPIQEGQLRELWLDPQSGLPRQVLLFLSGVWGQAYVLMGFTAVPAPEGGERYWLPESTRINLGYGFWTLEGLNRRVFRGSLSIQHDYQDYRILPEGTQLRFLPSQPPVDAPPVVAGLPGSAPQAELGDVRALGVDEQGNQQFSIGLGRRSSPDNSLEDRIVAFNLTRPTSRNALTQIDTLALLPLGNGQLPIYLFQFDTGRPLSPLQGVERPRVDPNEVFAPRPPAIRLFGD
ncbi:hypothetical protein NW820_06635 [Synechococcus sp. R55.7]|uniref:hypothetical protein n=1 Tax=Synechococcus sp. R55.7 TaxID=2964500 RepID=UPI0039C2025F